jgi:hypothetical protein
MTANKSRIAKIDDLINDTADSTTQETPKRKGRPKKSTIDSDMNNENQTTDFQQTEATERKVSRGRKKANQESDDSIMSSETESDDTSNADKQKKKPTNGRKTKVGKKRSDNRQVLVAANIESGKLEGIFLDAGHAAKVLGLNVKTIKLDMTKGTRHTKYAWLKVPAGNSLDQKEIERNAKSEFKVWKTTGGVPEKKKPGRKPAKINPEDITRMIKKTDMTKVDEKTMRKLRNIFANIAA